MPNLAAVNSRRAHYLEQYYNGEASKVDKYLRRVIASLRGELLKTNTVNSQVRIKQKLGFVEDLVKFQLNEFTDQLTEQIELFAVDEVNFSLDALSDAHKTINGVSVDLNTPSPNQLYAAVYARPFNNVLLKDYLSEFTKVQAKQVRNFVSTGFFEGLTTQQIIQGIVGTKSLNYNDGLLNVTRNSASRMVRTALSHTAAVAKDKLYKDNSDIVPYYEWLSTLDGLTSPICQKLDGKVFKVGKGRLPPAHPNCRSTTTPLFGDEVRIDSDGNLIRIDLGGTRASFGGQVSADLNYNDWLKMQSKAFQVDTLGKTKAELFRKGGLTVDKFVNDKGKTLTLAELKQRNPTAWAKI